MAKELKQILKLIGEYDEVAAIPLISNRLNRWKKYWVSYSELSEDVKEHDRLWARQVLEVINSPSIDAGCREAGGGNISGDKG